MKRIKYFALVLIITLGLFGVGYAYWTDAVDAEGSVSTGYLNVIITDASASAPNQYVGGSAEVVADGKKATFTISGLYPTRYNIMDPNSYVNLDFTIKNESTIPVVFTGADIEFVEGSSEALKAHVQAKVGVWIWERTEDLAELDDIFSHVLNGLRLEPGESFTFGSVGNFIRVFLEDPWVVDNSTQSQSAVFTVTLNWRQAV
ncbi:MAG TPA: hypothetical protein GX697_02710 [Firmicutes bacterium]|nr:hypothetical protein [Bacillota bacterium]